MAGADVSAKTLRGDSARNCENAAATLLPCASGLSRNVEATLAPPDAAKSGGKGGGDNSLQAVARISRSAA
jgi:hypothetical protein